MVRLITAAALGASFAARFPNAHSATLESVSASAAKLPSVEAASVKGYAAVSGQLQWLKAKENFFVGGEIVKIDDFVQVQEDDARRIVALGRADLATDAEVAAAQKAAK